MKEGRLLCGGTDLVVLCGGRGTRLGALTAETPKPLLPVEGKPFLLYLLQEFQQEGFRRFLLSVHYRPERFEQFIGQYQEQIPGMELVEESEPLGTGGALRRAVEAIQSPVFAAVNGDSWLDQPILPVLMEHSAAGRSFTAVAVEASRIEAGAVQKGIWRTDPEGRILGFGTPGFVSQGWVNAGRYLFETDRVRSWPTGSYSFEGRAEFLLAGWEAGLFRSSARLLDIGTPQLYARAGRILKESAPPDKVIHVW